MRHFYLIEQKCRIMFDLTWEILINHAIFNAMMSFSMYLRFFYHCFALKFLDITEHLMHLISSLSHSLKAYWWIPCVAKSRFDGFPICRYAPHWGMEQLPSEHLSPLCSKLGPVESIRNLPMQLRTGCTPILLFSQLAMAHMLPFSCSSLPFCSSRSNAPSPVAESREQTSF